MPEYSKRKFTVQKYTYSVFCGKLYSENDRLAADEYKLLHTYCQLSRSRAELPHFDVVGETQDDGYYCIALMNPKLRGSP